MGIVFFILFTVIIVILSRDYVYDVLLRTWSSISEIASYNCPRLIVSAKQTTSGRMYGG